MITVVRLCLKAFLYKMKHLKSLMMFSVNRLFTSVREEKKDY